MIKVFESFIELSSDVIDIIKRYTKSTRLEDKDIKILNDFIESYGGLDKEINLYRVVSPKELGYKNQSSLLKDYKSITGLVVTPHQFVSTTI